MDMLILTAQDGFLILGALSFTFAVICALADWAIPRAVTLRLRKRIIAARQAKSLTPLMREEWQ